MISNPFAWPVKEMIKLVKKVQNVNEAENLYPHSRFPYIGS